MKNESEDNTYVNIDELRNDNGVTLIKRSTSCASFTSDKSIAFKAPKTTTKIPIISEDIKDLLTIKLKKRHDTLDDQFSRIVMVKMLLISSLITSMEYYNDKMRCISPPNRRLSTKFMHSACWIRGFYIFSEMNDRVEQSSYYGIPRDIEMDGILASGKLCRTYSKLLKANDPDCKPLEKMYFRHYQYFPFYVASMAVIYFMPYILFMLLNDDIISLKTEVQKSILVDSDNIIKHFFNYKSNGGVFVLRLKILGTLGIKFMYLLVNLSGFVFTDTLLYGRFRFYGVEWLRWSSMSEKLEFDNNGDRAFSKPGNVLLPSMGFCDITEGTIHKTQSVVNDYKIICEISSHIHYQYILVVLWFFFIASIAISFSGFLNYMISRIYLLLRLAVISRCCRKQQSLFHRISQTITLREIDYLNMIHHINVTLYDRILHQLNTGKYSDKCKQNNKYDGIDELEYEMDIFK